MAGLPADERLKQEDLKFEASMDYIVRIYLPSNFLQLGHSFSTCRRGASAGNQGSNAGA